MMKLYLTGVAAVMTAGDVTIRNAVAAHLAIVLDKLTETGAHIEVLPDGSMLVSDDQTGAIYRISYRRP